MNTIIVKPTTSAIRLIIRPQSAIQVRIAKTAVITGVIPYTKIIGQTTADTGDKVLTFGATYALLSYNVAYVRGYLTASPEVSVPITSIVKSTTGLTVSVPTDGVTLEWAIELTTV